MDKKSFRKLIVETVTQVFSPDKFQQDIGFLKDYHLIQSKMINGADTWKFEFRTEDNSYISHAFLVRYPNDVYKMRLEVDWKIASRDNTSGAGKDFVMAFGPYISYELMVEEVNRKLNNNPMIGPKLYMDNNDLTLDNEIISLLMSVKEKIGEIRALDHPSLKTLENVYELIKDIPENELGDFCEDHFKGWTQKQGMIYKLQNIDKIPYYRSLRSTMQGMNKEPFPAKT